MAIDPITGREKRVLPTSFQSPMSYRSDAPPSAFAAQQASNANAADTQVERSNFRPMKSRSVANRPPVPGTGVQRLPHAARMNGLNASSPAPAATPATPAAQTTTTTPVPPSQYGQFAGEDGKIRQVQVNQGMSFPRMLQDRSHVVDSSSPVLTRPQVDPTFQGTASGVARTFGGYTSHDALNRAESILRNATASRTTRSSRALDRAQRSAEVLASAYLGGARGLMDAQTQQGIAQQQQNAETGRTLSRNSAGMQNAAARNQAQLDTAQMAQDGANFRQQQRQTFELTRPQPAARDYAAESRMRYGPGYMDTYRGTDGSLPPNATARAVADMQAFAQGGQQQRPSLSQVSDALKAKGTKLTDEQIAQYYAEQYGG